MQLIAIILSVMMTQATSRDGANDLVEADPLTVKTMGSMMHHSSGYSGLPCPMVLEFCDIDRWAQALDLSDGQRQFLILHYEQFVKAHNDLIDTEGKAIADASHSLAILTSNYGLNVDAINKVATEKTERVLRGINRFEQLETALIDSIINVLAERQIERTQMLRWEANRRQSRNASFLVRWTDVELRLVLESLEIEHALEREEVHRSLVEHEATLTQALRALSVTYWESASALNRLFALHASGRKSSEEVKDEYQSIRTAFVFAARRVSDLTKKAVKGLEDSQSTAFRAAFVLAAKSAAFPELYPDNDSVFYLFDALILEENQPHRSTLEAYRQMFSAEYRIMSEELEDFCINWSDGQALGLNGYQQQFFGQSLNPLLEKRRQLCAKWRQKISDLVGQEIVEGVSKPPVSWNSEKLQRATGGGRCISDSPPAKP